MIEHFSHGYLTLAVAFTVSMTGSALGLLLSRHARRFTGTGRRALWLVLAAMAIGGTGIWVMHFVAMLGFDVHGAVVRYDRLLTATSAVIAMTVVALGLLVIGLGRYSTWKLLVAGFFTGLGIAAMHYTGMAAVTATVSLGHAAPYVAGAIAIAIGAATVALWLAWRLEHTGTIWLAAAVMALAVNAMHYTAMMGVRLGARTQANVDGVSSTDLIFPMAALTVIVLLCLVYVVLTAPTADDLKADARFSEIEAELAGRRSTPPATPAG